MTMLFSKACSAVAIAVAMIVTTSAQPGTYPQIAGYIPYTNVTSYLERDLIQKDFEAEMVDESCTSFMNDAKPFWKDDADPEEKGGYFKSIPTYTTKTSDEWDEYLQCTEETDFHIQWMDEVFRRFKTTYAGSKANANFKNAFSEPSGSPGVRNYGLNLDAGPPADGNCIGFEESAKKTTAYMFGFIEAVQLMEKAFRSAKDGCSYQADGCEDAINAWDASVAIYVGSLEGTDGNNCPGGCYGNTLYSLADKRCPDFKTCGLLGVDGTFDRDETAYINTRIMTWYEDAKPVVVNADYSEIKRYKKWISAKMMVPFVQGVFKNAWRLSDVNDEFGIATRLYEDYDKLQAKAGSYGLLAGPKLWACSKKAYNEQENEIKIGGPISGVQSIDFPVIKLAYECNYQCLGISCEEVGALYDENQTALLGAEACDDGENGSSQDFVCGKQSNARRNACKMYRGQSGIPRRRRRDYYL